MTSEVTQADSGMDGQSVELAELVWANLPTNRSWASLPTYEKALVCHTLARLTAQSGEGRSGADAPRLNVICETTDENLVGRTYLEVLRVEAEDDGSFTAVVNHWPVALNARQSGEGERVIEKLRAENARLREQIAANANSINAAGSAYDDAIKALDRLVAETKASARAALRATDDAGGA